MPDTLQSRPRERSFSSRSAGRFHHVVELIIDISTNCLRDVVAACALSQVSQTSNSQPPSRPRGSLSFTRLSQPRAAGSSSTPPHVGPRLQTG